jgi:hypothetical protein
LSRKRSNKYQGLKNSFQSELFLWLAATCLLACVGKEMPISRIVIAVLNTTVVLLD